MLQQSFYILLYLIPLVPLYSILGYFLDLPIVKPSKLLYLDNLSFALQQLEQGCTCKNHLQKLWLV